MTYLAFIGPLGTTEVLVILIIGLLVFGSRLPEVGRSLGKGMMEFKRGLRGVRDEMDVMDRDADHRIAAELESRKNVPLPRAPDATAEHVVGDPESEPEFIDLPHEAGDPQPEADPSEEVATPSRPVEGESDAGPEPNSEPNSEPEDDAPSATDPRREP